MEILKVLVSNCVIICFNLALSSDAGIVQNYIALGQSAKEGEFPYQASLRYDEEHICGAAIIGSKWVVTAAECVSFLQIDRVEVMVGSVDVKSGVIHKVSAIIKHPEFNDETLENDIALVATEKVFEFNEKVGVIDFTGEATDAAAVLSGWGKPHISLPLSEELMWLETKTIPNQNCKFIYAPSGKDEKIFDTNICTYMRVNEGACHGDNGGPLVTADRKNLIGIFSWTTLCARGFPDVHTRVAKYVTWIKEQTQE